MLTAEGYRERRWGWLPALRRALEDKRLPSDGCLTSIDEGRAEALQKLLDITGLAINNQDAIRSTVHQMGCDSLHEDISRLERGLRGEAEELLRAARAVEDLHRVVEDEARSLPNS